MNYDEVIDRIGAVIKDMDYPVASFAKRLGVSSGYMERLLNNNAKPSMSFLNKLIRAFPVNREWLWFGEGEQYNKKDISSYKYSNQTNFNKNAVYGDESKGGRIKYVRSTMEYSQAQLAQELGTTRDVITQIETGRNAPASYILEGLYLKFGVNIHWLLTGNEKPFVNPEASKDLKRKALLKELEKLS